MYIHKNGIALRKLEKTDLPKLKTFCETCKDLGIINNSDFKNLKLDRMHLPYGQFFIGYDLEKDIIWNIAGVHHLPEIGPNAWRCLFRGAQLPTYTPHWSMNIFKSGVHFSYFLYLQIEVIQQIDPNAEFYISTNIHNSSGAKRFVSSKILTSVQFLHLAFTGRQGLPEQIIPSVRSLVTTDAAVTTVSIPIETPGPTKVQAPTHAPSPTLIGSFRYPIAGS
jgi:hypothetical protein